jgi:response regulator RpfG family c-di-GMP phosphodiesterase
VLLVDPILASRHSMWRVLSRAFGVLEAESAAAARAWMTRRPDIDALVVEDDLPDERGLEFVRGLAKARHPIASRAIVLSRTHAGERGDGASANAGANATVVARGDLREVLSKLGAWILTRDAVLARAVLREAQRFQA